LKLLNVLVPDVISVLTDEIVGYRAKLEKLGLYVDQKVSGSDISSDEDIEDLPLEIPDLISLHDKNNVVDIRSFVEKEPEAEFEEIEIEINPFDESSPLRHLKGKTEKKIIKKTKEISPSIFILRQKNKLRIAQRELKKKEILHLYNQQSNTILPNKEDKKSQQEEVIQTDSFFGDDVILNDAKKKQVQKTNLKGVLINKKN
jgi:hypothetical protein